jgi:hypothetical protein
MVAFIPYFANTGSELKGINRASSKVMIGCSNRCRPSIIRQFLTVMAKPASAGLELRIEQRDRQGRARGCPIRDTAGSGCIG